MSNIKGLDSFFDVLAMINNPNAYEQKIKELKEQTDKYRVVVEAVVELAKVNDYTMSIRDREEKSKELLVNAENTAKKIIDTATIQAQNILDEKRVELKKVKEQLSSLKTKELALQGLQEEINKKQHQLSIVERTLTDRENLILQKEKEINDRLNKLKSIMI